MPDDPGLGNTVKEHALRVVIVGHASPRWNFAKTPEEANRLNRALSEKRASNTEAFVKAALRKHLGQNVQIDVSNSSSTTASSQGIEVGSTAWGSLETLQEANGNRKDNSDGGRRVDVTILKRATVHSTGGSTRQTRILAYNTNWFVKVTRLHVYIAAGVYGTVNLLLLNYLSSKMAEYTATVWGGGLKGDPKALVKAAKKGKLANTITYTYSGDRFESFTTDKNMGFADFNDQFVRFARAKATLLVGAHTLRLTFPNLGSGASNIRLSGGVVFGIPKLEAAVFTGQLRMISPHPGDYYDIYTDDYSNDSRDSHSTDAVRLLFDTGSAELTAADKAKLETYISTWAYNNRTP